MDETSQKIIDAAMTLIRDQGYVATTTKDIARAAGVNECTLFRKFGNKKDIVLQGITQEKWRANVTPEIFKNVRWELRPDLEMFLTAYMERITPDFVKLSIGLRAPQLYGETAPLIMQIPHAFVSSPVSYTHLDVYKRQHPERALALWDLITTDREAFDAFFYGIEGVSYELNDKGEVKTLDPDNYAASAMWAARTTELNRNGIGTPDRTVELKKEWDAYIKDGVGSQKYRSFVLDTSSIETEYAACQNVHQQYWWPLELGYTEPVSGLKEYQEKMEAAGIEKVREVLQQQLDAYIAGLGQ